MINKRSELLATIEKECLDVLSLCVSEILPKNPFTEIQPVELQIEGFDCFTNLQTVQCHRGVAMRVRKSFQAQPFKLQNINARESLWCEIPLKQDDRLTVYRSPNSDVANNAEVNEFLSRIVVGRSHVVVCGDFNYPDIDWLEGLSPRDDSHPASKLLDAVRDSFLVQHVRKPAHFSAEQTPNVLDLIFTSEEAMVGDVRHQAHLGKSHHQSLLFDAKCYTDKKQQPHLEFGNVA